MKATQLSPALRRTIKFWASVAQVRQEPRILLVRRDGSLFFGRKKWTAFADNKENRAYARKQGWQVLWRCLPDGTFVPNKLAFKSA